MIELIKNVLTLASESTLEENDLSIDLPLTIIIEKIKEEKFGDFSSNIAMLLASKLKKNPREIAQSIIKKIHIKETLISKVEMAGPGFINFFMAKEFWYMEFANIFEEKDKFGSSAVGGGKKVLLEFVSANPTGPLHIGHGRGAVVGDVLSSILKFSGYEVTKEYYLNDRGNQMDNLGKSTWVRYQQLLGKEVDFPEEGYKGSYISDIAKDIIQEKKDTLINKDEIDVLPFFRTYTQEAILKWIKKDLSQFGVEFDIWFSEKSLFEDKKVDSEINLLKEKGFIYKNEKALWLKSKMLGDEKDRVVVRANGEHTYFAADIAYHKDKYERGFDKLIDIWGADHHGYIPRMKAVISVMGNNKDTFNVILVQMVNLKRGNEQISMSTRSGTFVTLSEVLKEVGKDAARFFFMMRSSYSHLDFDMELAKRESSENPVYYVQYAHARIQSILNLAKEKKITQPTVERINLDLLNMPEEIELMKYTINFPNIVRDSALSYEPHLITYYIQELSKYFHSYYNKNKVITENMEITNARLLLVAGIQRVIKNALYLLGIKPMDKM